MSYCKITSLKQDISRELFKKDYKDLDYEERLQIKNKFKDLKNPDIDKIIIAKSNNNYIYMMNLTEQQKKDRDVNVINYMIQTCPYCEREYQNIYRHYKTLKHKANRKIKKHEA